MIAITHLVVSLLLIQLLYLDRNDAFVALMFGVFIDLDHLLGLGDYAKANGIKAVFDFGSLTDAGGHWKSLFHSPVAIAVVGPLSIASKLAIPLLFWGIHIAMDFVETTYLGIFSAPEGVFLGLAAFAFVSVRYADYLKSYSSGTLLQYVRTELASLRHGFWLRAPGPI